MSPSRRIKTQAFINDLFVISILSRGNLTNSSHFFTNPRFVIPLEMDSPKILLELSTRNTESPNSAKGKLESQDRIILKKHLICF